MLLRELNESVRGIKPPEELRGRIIAAACSAAEHQDCRADAFDRKLNAVEARRLDLLYEGEYNPDYHKNMVTRFNLCDPDDAEHLQGLVLSVSK